MIKVCAKQVISLQKQIKDMNKGSTPTCAMKPTYNNIPAPCFKRHCKRDFYIKKSI